MRSSRAGSSCVTTVRLLVVALLWVAAHGTFAAERLYVVLGSYGQLESARARLERLSQSIPRSLAIARAQSDRGTLYRIVAGPLDRSAARAFMEHASEAGVKDAWTLPEGAVNAMVIVYQEEGTTPRVPAQDMAFPSPLNGVVTGEQTGTERTAAQAMADYGAPVAPVEPEPSALERFISSMPGSALRGDVRGVYPTMDIPRFTDSEANITIDGRLNEPAWASVPGYDNMRVIEPDTLENPPLQTRTQLFYTERGLYVGMWNEQDPDDLIARLSSRDARRINRDGTSITLDTSGEGRYGYWFGVNLGGSLMDGTVLPERQFRSNWDGPWRGASAETEDGWTAEYYLPWSMMSMPEREGEREMAFYVSRKVAYKDERWAWPALPGTQPKFMSTLQRFRLEGVDPRQQYTIYPYVSATWDEVANDMAWKAGGDIFWRPTSNLQFSTTLNPDFGQVESDDVVVNLTAFETFFPEKRPFFLEGFEIFVTSQRAGFGGGPRLAGGSGGGPTTLVNTRRIGGSALAPLETDLPLGGELTDVELNKPTDLYGAAKIVGQGGPFRYGVLTAFEEDQRFYGTRTDGSRFFTDVDGRDFGVARLLYEDNAGGAYRALGVMGTTVRRPDRDATVLSGDYHYLTPRGKWNLNGQLMYSHITREKDGHGTFLDLTYVPRQGFRHSISANWYDEHLNIDDFGFLRRNDSIGVNYIFNWSRSNLPNFKQRQTNIFLSEEWNTEGRVVRSGIFLRQFVTLYNLSRWRVELDWFPERWDDRNSRDNGDFKIDQRAVFDVSYQSDDSRKFFYRLSAGARGEDKGGMAFTYNLNLTVKPTDRFSASLDLRYRDRHGWLVWVEDRDFAEYDAESWEPTFNMDFFFSAKQQLRFSLQWVGLKSYATDYWEVPVGDGSLDRRSQPAESEDFAISSMNIQIRYRWEIAPLSDLFIVYTSNANLDNPLGETFPTLAKDAYKQPLAEQLVVKLRYRFGS